MLIVNQILSNFGIQWCAIEFLHLLHKPYVNEVTLTEHNLYQKSFQSSQLKLILLRRLRSFQRDTVGLCRLNGYKVKSCQSWRFEKILPLSLSRTTCWNLSSTTGRRHLQSLTTTTLQPFAFNHMISYLNPEGFLLQKQLIHWQSKF